MRHHDLSLDPHQETVIQTLMKLWSALGVYRPASPSLLSMLSGRC